MTLLGTKGPENSKLYWQTDRTHLDKGLLHSLWSILKVKTSPIVHHLHRPHPHGSQPRSQGGCAQLEHSRPWPLGALSRHSWKLLLPKRQPELPFRAARLLWSCTGADSSPHILQTQCRTGMLTVRSEGPANSASLRLSPLVCKIRQLVASLPRSYCEDHTR